MSSGSDQTPGSGESDTPPKYSMTLAVLAFNHQAYVEEAVRAALAQTGPPLQIILSDDCSSDATFELMRRIALEYRGPHEVLLNRNERNLGLAEHLNRIAALARGDVIVLAAGDDISCPDRAQRIAAEFARAPDVRAVLSGYARIDEQGLPLGDLILPRDFAAFTNLEAIAKMGGWLGMGATFAYHRDCFTIPRPLPSAILLEDRILPFRAALLGRVTHIREPLVIYRVHGASMTQGPATSPEYERFHQQCLREELDWAERSNLVGRRVYRRVRRAIDRYPAHLERSQRLAAHRLGEKFYRAFYLRDVWANRLRIRLAALVRSGAGYPQRQRVPQAAPGQGRDHRR